MIPEHGLATQQFAGTKKEKTRITVHHYVNSTGTNKLPMWTIGKAKKPRCFKAAGSKIVDSLGITYRANSAAWMVTEIMVDWLRWLDRRMYGRRVILLLDNFSAHECAVAILEALPAGSGLQNTEICWLPPNSTSRLQPLDQGIIASFKAKYRKRWIKYILEQFDVGENVVATMNLLRAIQYCIRAWDEVTRVTIANCWSHSALNLSPITTETQQLVQAKKELQFELNALEQQQHIYSIMDVD